MVELAAVWAAHPWLAGDGPALWFGRRTVRATK